MQMLTVFLTLAAGLVAGVAAQAPVTGTFDTAEFWPPEGSGRTASKWVTFPRAFSLPPSIATGLNKLDLSNSVNPRIAASVNNISVSNAHLTIKTWNVGVLHNAASVWLAVAANDLYIQTGRAATDKQQTVTEKIITFPRPYSAPPKVVVWLTSLEMGWDKNYRVTVTAMDITATGFTIRFRTWGGSLLFSAAASWIAHPASRQNILSGSFSTLDVRSWEPPQLHTSSRITFPERFFNNTPTLVYALNYLDIGHKANLRVKATEESLSRDGWTWHVDGWADSIIYGAGGDYIAFV